MRSRISMAAAMIVLMLAGLGLQKAEAHARLVRSNPADKAQLEKAPTQIELRFNELLDDNFNSVKVFPAAELRLKQRTEFASGKPKVDAAGARHLGADPLGRLHPAGCADVRHLVVDDDRAEALRSESLASHQDGSAREGVARQLETERGRGGVEREEGDRHLRRLRDLDRHEGEARRADPEAGGERGLCLEPGSVLRGGGEGERGAGHGCV